MNLLQPFLEAAPRFAGRTAIVAGDGRRTGFAELLAGSAALAADWKRAGIGRGDRVLVAVPLGAALYAGLAALWRIGAVAVFPEPATGLAGLRHAARAARPKAFLAGGWFRLLRFAAPELWRIGLVLSLRGAPPGPDAAESLDAGHPALISFTSGSTGAPKAIVRGHGFLAAQNAQVAELLRPGRDDETDLVAFPVFVLANLALGVTSVLPNWNIRRHERADAASVARHMAAHGVTRALVPPSVCETLAAAGGPVPGLGAVFTGGGPVFPDLVERLQARMPGADIVSVYGSTEAEPIAHLRARDIRPADWRAMRTGAGLLAGAPVSGLGLSILDDEIVVTGDHVNKGYLDPAHDASTKLARDGAVWHRTGDAGALDAEGRLWLKGRLDGRAGPFHPFCVEAASRFWPGVRRSALAAVEGRAVLAVEGDAGAFLPAWRREARRIGDIRVAAVERIPLDRRHRSKVDYPALRRALRGV